MNQANAYDYEAAGFDGFLNRSVDELPQNNLDATGPRSSQIRHDSSQVSGSSGDVWRVGSTSLNKEGLRVAKEGIAIEQAQDSDLRFDTSWNLPRLIPIQKNYTLVEPTFTNQYANLEFAHGMPKKPRILFTTLSLGPEGKYEQNLPWMYTGDVSRFGLHVADAIIRISEVDDTFIKCRVDIIASSGLSILIAYPQLNFTFYCMVETNSENDQ